MDYTLQDAVSGGASDPDIGSLCVHGCGPLVRAGANLPHRWAEVSKQPEA